MPDRREIIEELRNVLLGSTPIADAVVPPLIFVVFNSFAGVAMAAGLAVLAGLAITVLRLLRGKPVRFALAGLAGTAAAAGVAAWTGSAEAFFVPGIVTGSLATVVAVLSLLAGKPMVAWTSMLVRRWPSAWYWHRQVRPAYMETTLVWAAFFAGRTLLQWSLVREGEVAALGGLRIIGGWPALVVLLIGTYIYGIWRLRNLGGPSVEEFREGAPPPWTGQRRGF